MRLCMFHPNDKPMERGWVGRVEGDTMIHLAAQTLQHFFTGGSSSRAHAEYPLADVTLLAPVPHPPSIRVFEDERDFAFANPASILGPGDTVHVPAGGEEIEVAARIAATMGLDGVIGGFTLFADCRASWLPSPKDRDFGLGLGPLVMTPDEVDPKASLGIACRAPTVEARPRPFDWEAARLWAAAGTMLRTGDLLVSPAAVRASVPAGQPISIAWGSAGVLRLTVA